jgi:16S rRNA (cytosine1407-C5)-methyltransferase
MRNEILHRTSLAWGLSEENSLELMNTKYDTTIRVNPLNMRKSTMTSLKKQYKSLNQLKWVENAYSLSNETVRPSKLTQFTNGEIIVQNAASFIPVLSLNPKPGDYILDLCAAPGGKSSHIAAITNNKARLLLNDTSRTRFFKMQKLMNVMGVDAEYSLQDGRKLSKHYGKDVFDKILLDAPCSGEANLDINNIDSSWSLATIKRLSSLQSKLIQEAYNMLKPGGVLVYSTCTIAPEENELVIESLLKHNIGAIVDKQPEYPVRQIPGLTQWGEKNLNSQISNCIRLLPSSTCKPFFIAKIVKTVASDEDDSYSRLAKVYS